MSDIDTNARSAAAEDGDYLYLPPDAASALDEVKVQADYLARATLSFWRFRQLGGGRFRQKRGQDRFDRPEIGRTYEEGVYYVSDHPEVRILNYSVLALLVLFESAANAYFFAQQSEFGLSGGIFQAAAVSLANVAVSYFIIGYWGLRHTTMPWKWTWPLDRRHWLKLFGLLAIVVGVTMALLVNLSAAHYRNILDIQALGTSPPAESATTWLRFPLISAKECAAILTPEAASASTASEGLFSQSIGSAATNAMCRPLALHSLDAMVLFALGVAISAFAAFEGRGADASFPGLSNAARTLETARRDLQYALSDYYEEYATVLDAYGKGKGSGEDVSLQSDRWNSEEKILRELDRRVKEYRDMLTSEPDLLRDEFAVPAKAVAIVTGETCEEPDAGANPTKEPTS